MTPLRPCHVTHVGWFAVALASLSTACRQTAPTSQPAASPKTIVCSFVPMYVFARNIVGDTPDLRVELMIPASLGCPHDYELSTTDARRLQQASAVVLSGGLETFAGDAVRRLNPAAPQIEAWNGCSLIKSDEIAHDDHVHAGESNPHVWLSPTEAIRQVQNIAAGLAAAFPQHRAEFLANADRYIQRLEAVRSDLAAAKSNMHRKQIVTSHDAFAYLARDLGLDVVAVLSTSPRQEPSSAELARIVKTIRAKHAAAVFCEPRGERVVAETVARESGVPLFELDTLTTATDDPPLDYYEQRMRTNLKTLAEALK